MHTKLTVTNISHHIHNYGYFFFSYFSCYPNQEPGYPNSRMLFYLGYLNAMNYKRGAEEIITTTKKQNLRLPHIPCQTPATHNMAKTGWWRMHLPTSLWYFTTQLLQQFSLQISAYPPTATVLISIPSR